MGTSYEDAVAALYQAPLDAFVVARKRLAGELKAGGDKAGAARLAKLARPTISAWAVNQLYWQSRETFDQLLAVSERLRAGDSHARGARREAMAKLRARAIELLEAGGHPAPEATLRRVATNLSALAAGGGFDPDPLGALSGDRMPSGFDVAGLLLRDAADGVGNARLANVGAPTAHSKTGKEAREREVVDTKQRKEAVATRAREEQQKLEEQRRRAEEGRREEEERRRAEERRAEEQRRHVEEERRRIAAERRRLEAALHVAKGNLQTRRREVEELQKQLAAAERMLDEARAAADDMEQRLGALKDP
jgi:flagellar biosynthesis GTPase FlhF